MAFSVLLYVALSFVPSGTPLAGDSIPELPFNHLNPVIYDNDDHRDMYTDEYLLALTSAGEINLRAIITTYSASEEEYGLFVTGRQVIIDKARASGFINLPDATAGPAQRLQQPTSNRIEATQPLNSAAGRRIIEVALQATPEMPLVLITGGQLTAVADAYLQNPRIADRIVICGIFGVLTATYNVRLDPWAWAIVVSRFRCVSIADAEEPSAYGQVFQYERPRTPKQRFLEDLRNGVFPSTPFYSEMLDKHHPVHPASYMEHDGDTPAAILLMRPDYLTRVERWRCTGVGADGSPQFIRDGKGALYLAVAADASTATKEFWRALENPDTRSP